MSHSSLPEYSKIDLATYNNTLNELIAASENEINSLISKAKKTYTDFFHKVELSQMRISQFWSPISHLNSVKNSDEIREVYNAARQDLTSYYTKLGQNEELFQSTKDCLEQEHPLSARQKRALELAIRDFKFSGIGLEKSQQESFAKIAQRLAELASKFNENVLDATQSWDLRIAQSDAHRIKNLPEVNLQLAAALAKNKEFDGWIFTLDFPSFQAIITHCHDRELREEIYHAYISRASNTGPNAGDFDNSPLINEILELRQDKAKILGYDKFSELSVATKMAKSSEEVITFLSELSERSLAQGKEELNVMKSFAKKEFQINELRPWDSSFIAEQMRQKLYDFDEMALCPWFELEHCLSAVFDLAQRLFGVEIKAIEKFDSWDDSVRAYALHQNGEEKAKFFLDLFARTGKRGGAWMDPSRQLHRDEQGELVLPYCQIVCNFNPPAEGQPSLLKHRELQTLLHEFGHALHHMLSEVEEMSLSGIGNVPWDAVELPSQIMENWAWDADSLTQLSKHYETGSKLPQDLLQGLLNAKNFNAATAMLRQLHFSLADMRIHTEPNADAHSIFREVGEQLGGLVPTEDNFFENSFLHIFAGGYCAGYYSYKWAEVLSADAFSKFEEDGIFNAETGALFRDCILNKGGSEELSELFKRFRGREPKLDALLRHSGIK